MALKPEKPANAAFFHHPDAVDTSRVRLMGRHAAGEGFLKGFVRHGDVDAFYCHTSNRKHFEDFRARVGAAGGGAKPVHLIPPGRQDELAQPGCLLLPGPGLAPAAWRRRAFGAQAYSLCGVNHTIASDTVMDSLGALLTSPVQPWDAIVCTSRAARAAMKRVIANYAEFLNARLGAQARLGVQLPVIPLGVDCASFLRGSRRQQARAGLRARLGISDDAVVVLFVGRLSFHAKAHPIPMYLALEDAARRTGRTIHLIQAGWFANDAIESEFREGARTFCPSVGAIFLDGRVPTTRAEAWAAADIFASLSDNIQETFGLTPIEAMAAGLPSVVSDWDGYRDTVRNGVDGFALPTWMPPPGAGWGLELPYDGEATADERDQAYNLYCGRVSQATAVDVGACAAAFAALIQNPDRRRTMGEAARKRAREKFDWSVVVAGYQALWRELAEIRRTADEVAPRVDGRPPHPLRDDPFALFASYPSKGRREDVSVHPVPGADADRLAEFRGREFTDFAASIMPADAELTGVLDALAGRDGPVAASELFADVPADRRLVMARGLGWLGKMGLLRLTPIPKVRLDSDTANVIEVEKGVRAYLEGAPNDVDALKALAATARMRQDIQTAVGCLGRIIALDPTDGEAFNTLGQVFAAANRHDQAIDCFRRAVLNDPGSAETHANLGRAHFAAGNPGHAVDSFLRALRLAPADPLLWTRLGVALRHEDHATEARECLEKAVALGGVAGFMFYHLGLARKSLGDLEGAGAAFAKALERQPNFALAAAGRDSLGSPGRGKGARVALYMRHDHHYGLLAPLFAPLAARGPVLFTGDMAELRSFDPRVVVFSDPGNEQLALAAPKAARVMVPGGYLIRGTAARAAELADHVCAASEGHAEMLRAAGVAGERLAPTGPLALDRHFAGADPKPPFAVPEGRRVVLYAPTAEPTATSAFAVGPRVAERLRGDRADVLVVVRPHPLMLRYAGNLIGAWRRAAGNDPGLVVVDDPTVDPVACLAAADVLVTDVSSMAFHFLAMDRPIVFLDPLSAERDADALEWRWRDIGETVADAEGLAAAVGRALDDPRPGAARRRECRDALFGGSEDGGAAARIVALVNAVAAGKA